MNHRYCRIVLHATWSTHGRLPLLTSEIERRCRAAIAQQFARLGVKIIAFGAASDHVHVVFFLPSTATVSSIIKAAKGASGSILKRESECLVGWSRGYYVASVDADSFRPLVAYVRDQRQRHTSRTTIDEFEWNSTES